MTKQLPKTKLLDMDDLNHPEFAKVNTMFDSFFGPHWPQVPLRRWEYVAAIVFSKVMKCPGLCLDAGSGYGNVFAKFLNKIDCRVHCVDPGIRMDHNKDNIRYYSASMTDLPFNDNHFDYVFAISSIEHVNAGKFKIEGMDFDTGDTQAMIELVRVLKLGGKLILTTDFADKYYPPPGLWPSGSHRIYNHSSFAQRLIVSGALCIMNQINLKMDWSKLKEIEPIGYNYTEAIFTFEKLSFDNHPGH